MTARRSLLYLTDLAYPARGRRYCDEDIFLSSRLREDFDLALCHPRDATALADAFDAVVIRNSGPVLHYRDAWDAFREHAARRGTRVYNSLAAQGDMAGKQYLLELSGAGFPVVPTVNRAEDLNRLPAAKSYAVKPKDGADSIGLAFLPRERLSGLPALADGSLLVQPRIDFRYEVSFVFVDDAFQYALYAPDPARRWELEPYRPTDADLGFARRFVDWNTLEHGIQRVDACRTPEGDLLLVELEDLNPYLSLDLVPAPDREAFVAAMKASLHRFLGAADAG